MAPRQRKSDVKDGENKGSGSLKVCTKDDSSKSRNAESDSKQPSVRILWRKVLGRLLLSVGMMLVVYWTSSRNSQQHIFALQSEEIQHKSQEVPCSKEFRDEVSKFKGCAPVQCGRIVTDVIVSHEEISHLLEIFKKGLAFGGSGGSASILDLHSGALSYGNSFINIFQKIKANHKTTLFTEQDFKVYRNVRRKIQKMIAYNFGIQMNLLYLTHPTFFSEMTPKGAKTAHDEYWHVHVDKETYPSFHYTSLLYLTNYETDFSGGRFFFVDKSGNMTIEPKAGRVSAFTSGAENPHFVEKVKSGIRYALTVSFTCDPKFAIDDPSIAKLQ